jgi:hypothetical protein
MPPPKPKLYDNNQTPHQNNHNHNNRKEAKTKNRPEATSC